MDLKEQRDEERVALRSIYYGDRCFEEVNENTYVYRYAVNEDLTVAAEISWGPNYPAEKPGINVDLTGNEPLVPAAKERMLQVLNAEAEQWLGIAMTYTMIEGLKDHFDEVIQIHNNSTKGKKSNKTNKRKGNKEKEQ